MSTKPASKRSRKRNDASRSLFKSKKSANHERVNSVETLEACDEVDPYPINPGHCLFTEPQSCQDSQRKPAANTDNAIPQDKRRQSNQTHDYSEISSVKALRPMQNVQNMLPDFNNKKAREEPRQQRKQNQSKLFDQKRQSATRLGQTTAQSSHLSEVSLPKRNSVDDSAVRVTSFAFMDKQGYGSVAPIQYSLTKDGAIPFNTSKEDDAKNFRLSSTRKLFQQAGGLYEQQQKRDNNMTMVKVIFRKLDKKPKNNNSHTQKASLSTSAKNQSNPHRKYNVILTNSVSTPSKRTKFDATVKSQNFKQSYGSAKGSIEGSQKNTGLKFCAKQRSLKPGNTRFEPSNDLQIQSLHSSSALQNRESESLTRSFDMLGKRGSMGVQILANKKRSFLIASQVAETEYLGGSSKQWKQSSPASSTDFLHLFKGATGNNNEQAKQLQKLCINANKF